MANKATKKSKKPKNTQPPPPIDPPNHDQPPETTQSPTDTLPMGLSETDFPPLPHSPVTDNLALGGRQARNDDNIVGTAGEATKELLPNDGMQVPGVTAGTPGKEEKNSLQIKIHLNLHAKVRLDLDAKLYGDVVIGLL
ncbi:hypothetical protein N7522_011204 [Penicillium canescens]|nr:hypothetical protein N7522_011204 [Penicillium canescens]